MKFYQEPEFEVKGNVVFCTLNCGVQYFFNGLPTIYSEFSVTDYAKCHPNDVFDELTGKRIAESRASVKAYREAIKTTKKLIEYNEGLIKEFSNNIDKFERLMNDEIEHVIDIVTDDENN